MRISKTKIKIVEQGSGQSLEDYEIRVQQELDRISEMKNVYGPALFIPVAQKNGLIITGFIQWIENSEKPESEHKLTHD